MGKEGTAKVLFVDLSNGDMKEETFAEDVLRKFLGGYGLAAKIMYDRQKPGVDPLGPDNMLGFLTGPLTGTPATLPAAGPRSDPAPDRETAPARRQRDTAGCISDR